MMTTIILSNKRVWQT